jgi:putative ABC transport system permease protein
MLKDFIRVGIRNVLRHKLHTLITVSSLAVGLACCGLIFLYAREELSYDLFNKKADRTYRVTWTFSRATSAETLPTTPLPLAPALARELPKIETTTRLWHYGDHALVSCEGKVFYEDRFFFADASFPDVFTVTFVKGDAKRALSEPYSVVLTESSARKYFGDQNPIGDILTVDGKNSFKVTGVIQDIPHNSHIRIDALASLSTLSSMLPKQIVESWGHIWTYTYIVAQPHVPETELRNQFPKILSEYYAPGADSAITLGLQPLRDIHLRSHLPGEIEANGNATYLYLLLVTGCFVLVLACINFINLNAAGWGVRSKEIGVRKVLGANRTQILIQLIGESVIVSMIAALLGAVLIEILLPLFNAIMAKNLEADFLTDPGLTGGLFVVSLTAGIISGFYPALALSGFPSVELLRNKMKSGPRAVRMREALVVVQFGVSIALITGTLVVYSQFRYIQTKDLGFRKSGLLVIQMWDSTIRSAYPLIANQFSNVNGVLGVTASSDKPPSESINFYGLRHEGSAGEKNPTIQTLFVDYGFLQTFGIDIEAGRDFSTGFGTDSSSAFIINETAANELGWGTPSNAIGKRIDLSYSRNPPRRGAVIGVVKDFHFSSLYRRVEPLVMTILPSHFFYIVVRIRDENVQKTLEELDGKWRALNSTRPFEYEFVEDGIDNQYQGVTRLGGAFEYFSGVALLIACSGLFGISAFNTARRTKEIGIRKVYGASSARITVMIMGEFVRVVCLANVIALPLAYFILKQWLQDFAYQVPVRPVFFVLAGGISLVTGAFVVGVQTLRTANLDPVSVLRYE